MSGLELIPNPYAAKSLKERMISVILEREDVGYVRWTPAGIYACVATKFPDLYPEDVSSSVLAPFHGEEFMEELEKRRFQRRVSQLPAHMLADSIGRLIIDKVTPLIFGKLDAALAGVGTFDIKEARALLKDSLASISANQGQMTGSKSQDDSKGGITIDDARRLLATVSPDRRQAIANAIAMELMQQVSIEAENPIDVEAMEG
jgi:hypothetical protein